MDKYIIHLLFEFELPFQIINYKNIYNFNFIYIENFAYSNPNLCKFG